MHVFILFVVLYTVFSGAIGAQSPSDLYRASVAAAEGAIQATDSRAARAWLELAPKNERGWEWYHYSSLISAATSERMLGAGSLADVDLSPSADLAAVGTTAGSAMLLNLVSGATPQVLASGLGEVYAVIFDRAGRRVAVGSSDRRIRVFDVATAALMREIQTDGERPLELVFDLTGEHVVAALTSGLVRSWNVATGDSVRRYVGHVARPPVPAVGILPSGEVISGSWDNHIRVWDPASGRSVRTLGPGYGGASVSTRWSEVVVDPKGRFVAGSGSEGGVHVWSTTDWSERVFRGHEGDVPALAVSPDGEHIASGGLDQSVRIWRINDGSLIATLLGHVGKVQGISFRRDGRSIVSVGEDGRMREWSMASLDRTNVTTTTSAYAIEWPQRGTQMLYGDYDGRLVVSDRSTGRSLRQWRAHQAPIIGLQLTDDGRVVSLSQRGPIKIWQPGDSSLIRSMGDSAFVGRAMVTTPDGMWIAAVSADRSLVAWDGRTGSEVRRHAAEPGRTPYSILLLRGTRKVVVGWSDGAASIWDLASGAMGPAMSSTHGRILVMAQEDRTGRIFLGTDQGYLIQWDGKSGTPIQSWKAHDSYLTALEISPTDGRLVSVAEDYIMRVWSTATRGSLATFRRLSPYCARFTPRGDALAVCGLDRRIRVLEGLGPSDSSGR